AAIQRNLLCLIDDAHAAAADFAEEAKVAEHAFGLVGAAFAVRHIGNVPHTARAQQLQGGEHLPKNRRQLRMSGGIFFHLGPLATLDAVEEFIDNLAHESLRGGVFHLLRVVHDSDSIMPPSKRILWSRSIARPWRLLAVFGSSSSR